jgi:hypothetical protein
MLVCRACNTRFAKGTRACPSCGRRAATSSSDSGSGSGSGESGSLSLTNPPKGKPKAKARPKAKPRPEIDLGLDESTMLKEQARPQRPQRARKGPGASASAPPAGPAGQIDADVEQVKLLLGEDPSLLEAGLSIYVDGSGEFIGEDFATPVGAIDLLCRDRKGGFVVVQLPDPDEIHDSVSAMLSRMGWVRKHLAEGDEGIRGVIVLEQLPEELTYAAAGAGGAISFKGFRLGLTFHDLDD